MADKEKYMIKVEGKLVEVTPDVYYAYFRMERQERWQEEKQQGHAVMSYDALDDGETGSAGDCRRNVRRYRSQRVRNPADAKGIQKRRTALRAGCQSHRNEHFRRPGG